MSLFFLEVEIKLFDGGFTAFVLGSQAKDARSVFSLAGSDVQVLGFFIVLCFYSTVMIPAQVVALYFAIEVIDDQGEIIRMLALRLYFNVLALIALELAAHFWLDQFGAGLVRIAVLERVEILKAVGGMGGVDDFGQGGDIGVDLTPTRLLFVASFFYLNMLEQMKGSAKWVGCLLLVVGGLGFLESHILLKSVV